MINNNFIKIGVHAKNSSNDDLREKNPQPDEIPKGMEDQYLIEEETLYIKKSRQTPCFVYTKTAGVLLITCVLLIVFEIMQYILVYQVLLFY